MDRTIRISAMRYLCFEALRSNDLFRAPSSSTNPAIPATVRNNATKNSVDVWLVLDLAIKLDPVLVDTIDPGCRTSKKMPPLVKKIIKSTARTVSTLLERTFLSPERLFLNTRYHRHLSQSSFVTIILNGLFKTPVLSHDISDTTERVKEGAAKNPT